jgi:hypothetical protein
MHGEGGGGGGVRRFIFAGPSVSTYRLTLDTHLLQPAAQLDSRNEALGGQAPPPSSRNEAPGGIAGYRKSVV